MFFKIIGILVVGFFVFVFLLGFIGKFWLTKKLGKIIDEAKQMDPSINPFEIEQGIAISLIKRNAYTPTNRASQLVADIEAEHFEVLSWYEVPELPDTNILGAYKEGVFAVIYDTQNDVHYELIAETVNDQLLVVSNGSSDKQQERTQNVYKKKISPQTGIGEAVAFFKANAVDSFKLFSITEFEKQFLRSHEI